MEGGEGWLVGLLVRWLVGSLVRWLVGWLVRWCVGWCVCVEGRKRDTPDNPAKRTKVTLIISIELVASRHCTNAPACTLEKFCKQMTMHYSPCLQPW